MKQSLYVFILWALGFSNQAQNIQISVTDKHTNEALQGVYCLANDKVVGNTNQQGILNLSEPVSKIKLTHIGYESMEIEIKPNQPKIKIQLSQSNIGLETVVVTASKIFESKSNSPVSIHKLSAKMLDETKASSIYEAINKTPGVMMANLNNEQHMMSIRLPISTSAYYLYLEDGIPVRPLGIFNHNALIEFNQFTVNSIEIVKGPTSSIYGPEAIGGTINFISNRPSAKPFLKVGVQGDQYNYKRIQYATSTSVGKWGFYLGGLYSDQKNGWITSSDYSKNSHFGKITYQLNPKIGLNFTSSYSNYYTQTSGNVDSISFYSQNYTSVTDFTFRKSYALRTKLGADFNWNNRSQTQINTFYRDNALGQNPAYSIRWTSGSATARGEINSNNFKSYGINAQHSQWFNWLNSRVVAGVLYDQSPADYWAYQIDLAAQLRPDKKSVEKYTITAERPDIQLSNYNATIQNKAVYSQFDFEPIAKLKVTAGFRYDQMAYDFVNELDINKTTNKPTEGSKSYEQFTSKIGLNYKMSNKNGVYANYSKGFSPPGLTAIFRKRPTPDADGNLFYYNLKPAQFKNYELGSWWSLLDKKIFVEAGFYVMKGRNELLNIRQPDNSTDYQSAGKTTHEGIELSVNYAITKNLNWRFGGTYSKHIFDEFILSTKSTDAVKNVNGKTMPSAPATIWNSEINYNPTKNLRMSLEWQHVGESFQNQINTVKYSGYDILNFRAGYNFKNIEIFTNVMNATNALYASNVSRGNNATDRSNFTPAAPRTVVLGLQFNLFKK